MQWLRKIFFDLLSLSLAEPFKVWLANLGSERVDEVFDPEKAVKRAGLDYWDKLEIEEHISFSEFLNKYKPEENNMFFATTKGKHVYSEPDYSKMDEVFLLFGKETKGLPEDILQKYIDKTIRIPMKKNLRSLNLSNSVSIVVYEVLRQKDFENLEEISDYFNKN